MPPRLAPLAPQAGLSDDPAGRLPAQVLVVQLIGALRTPAVLADPAPALAPLASLARRLAENAGASYRDAALAADLLVALQLRAPLETGGPGSEDRGHAIAMLLDACRADPQPMEGLAGVVARQLPYAVRVSAEARSAADRLLGDDQALRQWGGTVLIWIADAVVPAVPHDPDLARRLAATVLTFKETRDEQVSLGGSVLLPMHESRRQQAGHGAYRLGQSFAQLCAADVLVAVDVFCDLAEHEATTLQERAEWPVSVPGASGWLQHGLGRVS